MAENKSNNNTAASAIVSGLLGVAFVVLKLCGVIDWSWWWVTAPFWGPTVFAVAVLVVVVLIALASTVLKR